MKKRKILAGIIAAITLSVSIIPTSIASAAVKGDANGDGKFSITDAAYIARYVAKRQTNLLSVSTCDYNGDGRVNILDAASIAQTVAKNYTTKPSTDGWKNAYKQMIKDYKNIKFTNFDWKPDSVSYTLYDIDKDSTPELIIDAYMYNCNYFKIYTWDNKSGARNTGSVDNIRMATMGVLTDKNQFAVTYFYQWSGENDYIIVDINGNTTDVGSSRGKTYKKLDRVYLNDSDASSTSGKFIDEWTKPVFE